MENRENREPQHVFLVGAKSLGTYGGYETFINKLTEYHRDNDRIRYHVACKANGDGCMRRRERKFFPTMNLFTTMRTASGSEFPSGWGLHRQSFMIWQH